MKKPLDPAWKATFHAPNTDAKPVDKLITVVAPAWFEVEPGIECLTVERCVMQVRDFYPPVALPC